MSEITFIIHSADEGGYWAEAEGYPLFTQGESLDELSAMVRDAVDCFFSDPEQRPESICWRFAAREVAA